MPPIGGDGSSFLGASTIIDSVVVNKDATPLASTNAVLTTLRGSIMPCLTKSVYSPTAALYPTNLDDVYLP